MHSRALPIFFPRWRIAVPLLWLTFAAWIALLFYASSQPGKIGPENPILYWDKILHFTFFSGGAMSLGASIRATFAIRWATIFLVVMILLCGIGLGDEIHQLFVTGRSGGDPFDWLADLLGTAAGLAVLRLLYAQRPPAPASGNLSAPE